ncbi:MULTISPECIES: VlmB-like protein [Kitasatospora]|uniref:Putative VlmB homolog n=1 Tax=Kitasatospora setae (strain ATCC 33774 / DSM 43861 / JCM 3304 / KCC A-0304 / NBRC 14216 / KM-6054) TaxID=452652 RepID=E4N6B3_KITSK|nr:MULTISPECIES: VlmB-like protein [Kitasatospora]BAJ26744.1 putative VlmB homolog [Kitasatospora setae KM-6054]
MSAPIPAETGWDSAPGLLEGAMTLDLTPEQCDLGYWLRGVAQGTLAGRAETGHTDAEPTPEHMRADGPLRDAQVLELSCRSVAEAQATRVLAHYVAQAPDIVELEFFTTQLVDEARHSMVFRRHLLAMGVPADRLHASIAEVSAEYRREVLEPILDFALTTVRDEGDFVGGVAVFTIIIEGVLAPAAELSERKWNLLDPAAGAIARGAAIDEVRHLTVGSSVVRRHLLRRPERKAALLDIVRRGREIWDGIPDRKHVLRREELFQAGMREHADLLAGYEVWPGQPLLSTTPEQRYAMAEQWTDRMAAARLVHMGLPEAIDLLRLTD